MGGPLFFHNKQRPDVPRTCGVIYTDPKTGEEIGCKHLAGGHRFVHMFPGLCPEHAIHALCSG